MAHPQHNRIRNIVIASLNTPGRIYSDDTVEAAKSYYSTRLKLYLENNPGDTEEDFKTAVLENPDEPLSPNERATFFGTTPQAQVYPQIRTFTDKEVDELVFEILATLVDPYPSLTEAEAFKLLRKAVEEGLYAEWEVTKEGGLKPSNVDISQLPSFLALGKRFSDILQLELDKRSKELSFSPGTITPTGKMNAMLFQMGTRQLFDPNDKDNNALIYNWLINPTRSMTDKELEKLGKTEHDRFFNTIPYIENLKVFGDKISGEAIGKGANFSALVGTELQSDSTLDLLDPKRQISLFGQPSDTVLRQQASIDRIARIFSDPNMSPVEKTTAYLNEINFASRQRGGEDIVDLTPSTILNEDPEIQAILRRAGKLALKALRTSLEDLFKEGGFSGLSEEQLASLISEGFSGAILPQYIKDYTGERNRLLEKGEADDLEKTTEFAALNTTLQNITAGIQGLNFPTVHSEVQQRMRDDIFGMSRAEAKAFIRENADSYIRSSASIFAQEANEDYIAALTLSGLESDIREFLVRTGVNLSGVPSEVIARYAELALRENGLTAQVKEHILSVVEKDILTFRETEAEGKAFTRSQDNLQQFVIEEATKSGIIQPFGTDPFDRQFAQNIVPQLANEIARLGLTSTADIRAFIERETTPGGVKAVEATAGFQPFDVSSEDFRTANEIGFREQPPIEEVVGSTLGLQPFEVNRQNFLRQMGDPSISPEGTDRMLGIRPTEPFPEVDKSQFLPFATEAAREFIGLDKSSQDELALLNFFKGEIPGLQKEFQTLQNWRPPTEDIASAFDSSIFTEDFPSDETASEQIATLKEMLSPSSKFAFGPEQDPERVADIEAQIAQLRGIPNRRRIAKAGPEALVGAISHALTPKPPSALDFFEQQRPALLEKFSATSAGIMAESNREIRARNVEIEAENVASKAESDRRKKLRSIGRTVFNRSSR